MARDRRHLPDGVSGPGSADERELLSCLRSGDTAALAVAYERYGGTVLDLAYRITGSTADASDVVQDVFVGLADALRRYEDRGRFEAWLKQIAARTALRRVRAVRRRREVGLEVVHDATPEPHPLRSIQLERSIARLSEPLRLVLTLYDLHGFKHAEIAKLLDISESASGARLSRARKNLRRELAGSDW